MSYFWRFSLLILVGEVLFLAALEPPWVSASHEALDLLVQVPLGKNIVERVKERLSLKNTDEVMSVIKWGVASRTDAILTRHFNPATGEEKRDRRISVYLRKDQSIFDLVLDLAHELTHASARPSWDPYDPDLTPGKYILAAIDGVGGEVDALLAECQVGAELLEQYHFSIPRCSRYWINGRRKIEREKIRDDFYRVGDWQARLFEELGSEVRLFPLLSSLKPQLYSSTGQTPYPVALFQEYQEITEMACNNSRRRMIASSGDLAGGSVSRFLAQRCHSFKPKPRAGGLYPPQSAFY